MLKRFAAALILGTSLTMATPAPAMADPVTAAITAFAATPIGGAVIQLGLSFIAGAAETLIQSFIGKPSQPAVGGTDLNLGRSGVDPQAFLIGPWATAGSLNYHGSWGSDGGTPNAYYTQEIILSDLPMAALTGGIVGDKRITLPDMSGARPTPQGWPIAEFAVDGQDYMWWAYRDGSQTTPDAFLRSTFGDDADRPYTADMIGRGRACLTVTIRVNDTLYPGGQLGKVIVEASGIDLYNVAKDSSAGGSGTHRWDDPSTWEPSGNLAVQIYNVIKGLYWGDEWVFGLQDCTAWQLPASAWIAAINECDVAIALAAGGTEPQFQGGLEVTVDTPGASVINELLKGCAGKLAEIGGIYKPLVGAAPAPVYNFTDATVLITQPRGIDPFPAIDDTYNAGQGSYVEPAQGWSFKDAPPYRSPDLEAEDGGQRLAPAIQFAAVRSGTQAQRLLKGGVIDGRNFRRPTLVLPPEASELEPLDVVAWNSAEEGYSNKPFLIDSITDRPDYLAPVALLETDPSAFDWDDATDEQPQSVGFLTGRRPAPQITVGFAVTPATIADQDGAPRKPAVTFSWDGDIDDVRAVGLQLRTAATGALIYSDSTDDVSAGAITVASAAILANQDLQARGKYYPRSARTTRWSNQDVDGNDGPWLDVTTPDVPEIADIQVAQLGTELRAAYGLVVTDGSAGSLADQLDAIIAAAAQQAAANLDAQAYAKSTTDVLRVQTAKALAAVLTEQLARIDADSALAEQITEVLANVNNVIADGYLRLDAEVDGDAATATITAKVRATSGSGFSEAGWIIKAVADGLGGSTGYFGVLGAIYVFDDDGNPIPAISLDQTGLITGARLSLGGGKILLDGDSKIVRFST